MADLFTAGGSGASWDNLVETAYNQEAAFALRDDPVWAQVVDTRAERQAMPGSSVVFTIHKDLASTATTPLTETSDVAAVAAQAPDRVTVTLEEYGNVTKRTEYLDRLAFTDPAMELAVIVGRNMVDSYDEIIRTVADGSTNLIAVESGAVTITGAAAGSVTSSDKATGEFVATAITKLRGDKVTPIGGAGLQGQYLAIAHPDVVHDVMLENAATAWIYPHTYGGDTAAVYNAEVGTFRGARFLSTTRVKKAADGSTGAEVYRTYFLGREAIAEAVATDPHIVVGPQVDNLKRFATLGWKALCGFALYRPEALRVGLTSSSVASL